MIDDQTKRKLRTVKNEVEKDGEVLQNIVEQLVARYNRDLDDFMEEVKHIIDNREELDDLTLEKVAIRVPVYMYFSSNGLEALGIQYDHAKAKRLSEYNTYFMDAGGTIKDKEAEAGLKVIPETMMEEALKRAYKLLKTKLEACEHLNMSIRKVIGKRTQEQFTAKFEQDGVERMEYDND